MLVGIVAAAGVAGTALTAAPGGQSPTHRSTHRGCSERWAAVLRGRPLSLRGSGYWIWRDPGGWHVRAGSAATRDRFVGSVETARMLRDVDRVRLEKRDDISSGAHRIRFRLNVSRGDLDGVDFTVGCGAMRFDLSRQHAILAAASIHLGAAGHAPARSFAAPDPPASGIKGCVVAGGCPVEGTTLSCPKRPVETTVDVSTGGTSRANPGPQHRIASVATDNRGRFQLTLPPGDYQLTPRSPGPRLVSKPANVRVESDLVTKVELLMPTEMY